LSVIVYERATATMRMNEEQGHGSPRASSNSGFFSSDGLPAGLSVVPNRDFMRGHFLLEDAALSSSTS